MALNVLLLGCEVTSEKVQVWKNSVNGPKKLLGAVASSGQPLAVRVEAAEALTELGRIQELTGKLAELEQNEREQLTTALAKSLTTRMKGAGGKGTFEVQIQAKDALFGLRGSLSKTVRQGTDSDVVSWMLLDWSRRSTGEHGGEKIARAVGAPAAALVAREIGGDPAVVVQMAQLLAEIGGLRARVAAAEKLLPLVRAPRGATPSNLEALGYLNTPSSRAELLKLAVSRGAALSTRVAAMAGLARGPDDGLVGPLAEIARTGKETNEVRDAAFAVLEQISSDAALKALGVLLSSSEAVVRYRAVEAMVNCCKAKGVAKLLDDLPLRYTYAKADVSDYLEKDIRELGNSVLPTLRGALASKSWLARLVAARVLADIGTAEDVPRLKRVIGDRTRIPGWGAGETLGAEAGRALKKLQQRL